MLAPTKKLQTMYNVRPEDRALLESNPSVGLDAGGWTGASDCRTPPPSRPSIGRKAINSRPESGARRKPKKPIYQTPVGHMSVSLGLFVFIDYNSGAFRLRLRSRQPFGPKPGFAAVRHEFNPPQRWELNDISKILLYALCEAA